MPSRLHAFSTRRAESNVADGAPPSDAPPSDTGRYCGDDSGWIAAADGDQFKRDIAAIERATATLRRAEPSLQSWAEPAPILSAARPLWLVIGMLWFSTALVTLSAVFAIYVLVG